ncbi:MAG: AAA family ATPase [Prevotellaceae bacterium]|nr:AAA family ATPase [Candidatus Colivivens caballi]
MDSYDKLQIQVIDQQWADIVDVCASDHSMREKYGFLYSTLHRLCTELVQGLTADYSDFFSRLQAVCRMTKYPLYGVDRFRWRARRVVQGTEEADDENYAADLGEFVKAYAHFTNSVVPEPLRQYELAAGKSQANRSTCAVTDETLRGVIDSVDAEGGMVMVRLRDYPQEEPVKLMCNRNEHTLDALNRLEPGMQICVVNCVVDAQGVTCPELIVIDPDYLVDITSLTKCIKPYGDTVWNSLLNKLAIDETTQPILMGAVANQFLDDLVNNPDANYVDSMREAFRDNLLAFTTCKGFNDSDFAADSKKQFQNIKTVVGQLVANPDFLGTDGNVILEPTFFCPNLGIQGRFDFLQGNMKNLIELKSGKCDEYNKCAREEHLLQMILYKEIMHQNLGIRQVNVGGFLLYSKYPMLQEQRTAREMVWRMMTLRNKIVLLEHLMKEGGARQMIDGLSLSDFKTRQISDNYWLVYGKPEIEAVLDPLHQMDDLTADYFYTFLRFLSCEQYLNKVGDGRIDSTRGMASLWNADVDAKQSNGDMLAGLRILNIERDDAIHSITFLIPDNDKLMPNFRIGDSVILYQRNDANESPVTQQVIRCSVANMEPDTLTLSLRFSQRNEHIFPLTAVYAVEHDFIDSAMRSQFESLMRLVTAPQDKRDLLLCRRMPRFDQSVCLVGNYLNDEINDIVLRAKQAQDYFLLVGPPGTGKTSVALRSMVDEFLAEGQSVLLLSYTNRAVDEICEQLTCDYIRLGRELSCAKEHQPHLLGNRIDANVTRNDVKRLLTETPVVVSTVASMCSNKDIFKLRTFDVTIIDEASQILEPQIVGLLTQLGKFVMIGDHKQLPAVVVQDEERSRVTSPELNAIGLTNCRNSLFERLISVNRKHQGDTSAIAMLSHQGRMHSVIGEFASRLFYEDGLQPVPLQHQTEELPYADYDENTEFVATTRFGFIDVPLPSVADRMPKLNVMEAQMIAELIVQLMDVNARNGLEFNPVRQLGVIVPFRRQIAAVRSAISAVETLRPVANDIMIDTVERYQGSQRDVIIYGTTVTRPYELQILSNMVEQDGVTVDRKLNVAVTRARKQLFVFGNERLLRGNELYRLLIEAAKKKN